MKINIKEKLSKKNIILAFVVVIAIGSYFYHNYSTSAESNESTPSIDVDAVYTSQKPDEALKNTAFKGTFTDEEKSKIVELTDKLAKVTINNDYKTNNIDTLKVFVNCMDDKLKSKYSDDVLQKQLDNLISNEHVSKLQDITYTNVAKDENNDLTVVKFTATVRVVNDKNPKESGKTFSNVECGFAYDKDWKVSQFSIGEYK